MPNGASSRYVVTKWHYFSILQVRSSNNNHSNNNNRLRQLQAMPVECFFGGTTVRGTYNIIKARQSFKFILITTECRRRRQRQRRRSVQKGRMMRPLFGNLTPFATEAQQQQQQQGQRQQQQQQGQRQQQWGAQTEKGTHFWKGRSSRDQA